MSYEDLMKYYELARAYLEKADITTKEKAIKVIEISKKMTSELDKITKEEIGKLNGDKEKLENVCKENTCVRNLFSKLRERIVEKYSDEEIYGVLIK